MAIVAGSVSLAALLAVLLAGAALLHRPRPGPPSTGGPVSLSALQSTDGTLTLRGRPTVVLTFASGLDGQSRDNLRRLMAVAPALQRRGVAVVGLSVDELPVLKSVKHDLGLNFPLVSEGPGYGFHPFSEALGVFHGPPAAADAPVDATALFVIAADGRVQRALVRPPGSPLPPAALNELP